MIEFWAWQATQTIPDAGRNLQRNSKHFLRVWRLDYSMLINFRMHTDNHFKISINLIASQDSLWTIMFEKSEFHFFMVVFVKLRARI